MSVPCLATPKRGWNDRGYRAGLAGATVEEIRELAAAAEADAGEEFGRQVWVGWRAARQKLQAVPE